MGAFVGACRTQDSSITLQQPDLDTDVTFSPVHYDAASFESPPYYGYRVGLFPSRGWFGVEGEFIHFKVFADTARSGHASGTLRGQAIDDDRPLGQIVERFSISHGVNVLLVNAVVRRQGPHPTQSGAAARWSLIARAGAGPSIPHPESTIGGVSVEQYEWGAWAVQIAGGAEMRIAGPLFVTGEYKWTRTKQNVTVAAGSAQTTLASHHLVFGVAAHVP